jgi:AbrB family looped-hinge helix DNA binding protein
MSYHFTMQIAIDKLGRIVVPKPIRDRYHLQSGTVLELEPEADGIRLSIVKPKDSLITKQGILVHHGTTVVDLDIADFINMEREMRNGAFFAEHPEP